MMTASGGQTLGETLVEVRSRIGQLRERAERDAVGPPAPQDDDPAALGAYLHALHRHSLRLGLYRLPATEPDERVVVAADADLES